MPSSMNWVDGPAGGTPTSAANLNKLAVVADVATRGTPTGDALRAAIDARLTSVVDNGDGTATTTSATVVDNLDGTAAA